MIKSVVDAVTNQQKYAQARKIALAIFQKFDYNANGTLSRAQFPGAVNFMMIKLHKQVLCNQDITDLFDMIDANGDQSICLDQLVDLIIMIQQLLKRKKEIKLQAKQQVFRKGFSTTSGTSGTLDRMNDFQ